MRSTWLIALSVLPSAFNYAFHWGEVCAVWLPLETWKPDSTWKEWKCQRKLSMVFYNWYFASAEKERRRYKVKVGIHKSYGQQQQNSHACAEKGVCHISPLTLRCPDRNGLQRHKKMQGLWGRLLRHFFIFSPRQVNCCFVVIKKTYEKWQHILLSGSLLSHHFL